MGTNQIMIQKYNQTGLVRWATTAIQLITQVYSPPANQASFGVLWYGSLWEASKYSLQMDFDSGC